MSTTIWLVIMVALIVGEAITVGLTFIWFAAGALGGLLVAALGGNIWLQVLVFLAVSALALALVRPVAAKLLQPGKTATNADRVIGETAVVTQTIDNIAGQGTVKIAGQPWTARSQLDVVIPEGTRVKVIRIEGVKVYVEAV